LIQISNLEIMSKPTFSNVTFVQVLPAKAHHKEEYCAVQLLATEVVKNSKTLLLGGPGIERKRYVIQTMQKVLVDAMKLQKGDDFVAKLKTLGNDFADHYSDGARIATREITEDIYNKLDEDKRKAYQAKLIPGNPEKKTEDIPLYHNGKRIYFTSEFVSIKDKKSQDNILTCSTMKDTTVEEPSTKKVGAVV
jgi:hypothetical protein